MSKHFLFIVMNIKTTLSSMHTLIGLYPASCEFEFQYKYNEITVYVIFLLSNSREYYFVPAVVSFCSPMIKGNLHDILTSPLLLISGSSFFIAWRLVENFPSLC